MLGVDLGLFTVIVGHATFCIVVVYNNVVARLRRVSTSFEEASADLGAHTWQTFRFVTLPSLRTALAAGALLAFALSFDEIIVTTFTIGAGEETLPIWIFRNLFRPNQLPIVNVVAVLVVLISIVPVYLAHRLTREEGGRLPLGAGAGTVEGGVVGPRRQRCPNRVRGPALSSRPCGPGARLPRRPRRARGSARPGRAGASPAPRCGRR